MKTVERSEDDTTAMEAVADLYHAFVTGLILTVITRAGERRAADLVFHLFRRKHLEQFLPGLEKLGLIGLPDAVAAARYHYLSNFVGGVKVEYVEESERKAWIRYPPPRWIWLGTAIAAVPSEVSAAMLRGWHAHNGVSLGNRRLGFVCTKQTVDGQPGLEGYYFEHDGDLEPEERLRFARGEEAPPFDPDQAPRLPAAGWPEERRRKAFRNYAMDYVQSALRTLVDRFGPSEASALGGHAATVIALQFYDEVARQLRVSGRTAEDFAALFVRLARAQGDEAVIESDGDRIVIRQTSWRLMRGVEPLHPTLFEIWNRLWAGCLAAHDRFARLEVRGRLDLGDATFEWRLR